MFPLPQPQDESPEVVDLPDSDGAELLRRVRYWLIRKLAQGDLVYLNSETICPPGWCLSTKSFGQGVLCAYNDFRLDSPTPLPMAVVICRTPE
jgi:hypothetical protein